MRKTAIFDVMGVIFKVGDDTNNLLVPYIRRMKPSITMEFINQAYLEASLGRITSREFWGRMGFEDDHESIERDYLDTCLNLDDGFIKAAEELRADYDLAVLSNDVSEWSAYLRRKHGLDRLFGEIVISGDAGLRKPDINIYRLTLSRLNTPPGDCVFIDDRYKNLKPASELGIKTIRFGREALEKTFEPDAEIQSFAGLKEAVDNIFGC